MPRRLPPYCFEEEMPSGNYRIRFRKAGLPKVPLHGMPWTPGFMEQYERALKGELSDKPERPKLTEAKEWTWRWLCEQYINSPEFGKLKGTTPHTRKRILESTYKEPINPDAPHLAFGDMPVSKMTPLAVRTLRDRKAHFGTAGNDRRKIIGYVFEWAMEAHKTIVLSNPVREVKKLEHKAKPVPPWLEPHFHLFMQRYPAGSKERRAMALHLYTGARGCDVRCFGPQHIQNGRFVFTQQKTGGDVDVIVLNELAKELALAPKTDLAFILTEYGKTFSGKGYGNWFNRKCREAGLGDRTAHGIRSGAATIAANNGATVHQLMAMFGWMSESMAIRYTEAANRKRLADGCAELIRLENREAI